MFQRSDLWSNLFFITTEGIICNTYWGDFKLWTVFNKYFLAPELEILEKKVNKKSDLRENAPWTHSLLKFYGHEMNWELFGATKVDRFTFRDSSSSFENRWK